MGAILFNSSIVGSHRVNVDAADRRCSVDVPNDANSLRRSMAVLHLHLFLGTVYELVVPLSCIWRPTAESLRCRG